MHISILALNDTSSVFSHKPLNLEQFSSISNETGQKKQQKKPHKTQAYVLQYAVHCIDMCNTTCFCESAQL